MERVVGWIAGVGLLLVVVTGESESNLDRISELLQLQSLSKDGVIRLDDITLKRFANPKPEPRPYSLIIFFDALQLRENSDLKLEELRREYGFAASAYVKQNGDSGRVFFCDLEFKQSQTSFQAFGVSTLPHIKHLPPGSGSFKDAEVMEQGEFHRSAEGMAAFVETKAKIKVGPIERPPAISKNQLLILAGGLAVVAPFVLKKLASKDTPLHDPKVWCVGGLMIYFFSVSGGMHNIIRKIPLFMNDRNNPGKRVFFHQGAGMQLGAEGYVVGLYYSVVGTLLAFVTHFLVEIKSKTSQRLIMLVVMAIGLIAVQKVIALDNWKTGYRIHGFWPNRWR